MKKIFFLFSLTLLILPLFSFGAFTDETISVSPCGVRGTPPCPIIPCGGPTQDPCRLCHVFVLGGNIINFFLIPDPWSLNKGFAPVLIVATILIVAGGFLLMTAGGDPTRLGKAKAVLTAVVIGLIIIYASGALLATLFTAMDVIPDFSLKSWTHTKFWCPVN